jgi:TolA-binding protein
MGDAPEPWHLDKRIPVALILTLLGQMAVAIWWARGVDNDVAALKTEQAALASDQRALQAVQQAQAVSAGRMEQDVQSIKSSIDMLRADQRETNQLLRQYLEGKE